MQIDWVYEPGGIDWDEVSRLFSIAPLGDNPPDHYQTVFTNSRYMCFTFEGSTLVGAGRALADGRDASYLADIVVHPDYQGKGLGKQIVQKLVDASKGHKKIILYANPGKEGFYQKLGFKMMNTAMAIFGDQEAALTRGVIRD